MKVMMRIVSVIMFSVLLLCSTAIAQGTVTSDRAEENEWITFLLLCNEGMLNDGGDVGNTVMIISINIATGSIKQLIFAWDTFIDYPGFEAMQLLDKPFRVGGPEETMKIFNENFNQNIDFYLSINFLNLASLIDDFGGVTVDVTRAERNALNGMVASKLKYIEAQLQSLMLDEVLYSVMLKSCYLEEYGAETHLNGLQAVGFGWLQYDSVANCCKREAAVIADLFDQVASYISERVTFFSKSDTPPKKTRGKRLIDLDDLTDDDIEYLYMLCSPIFNESYTNLTKDEIENISIALAHDAYNAYQSGEDIFSAIEYKVFPFEVGDPYTKIAGKRGHTIDFAANTLAINHFLYNSDEAPMLTGH